MFEKSDSIAKLAEALSKAQGEIEGAKKDSSNPFFKSNYADLGSVWEACRQPLAKNGLSVAQLPAESNGGVTLITILMHSSGEYIKSQYSVPCKPDAQSVGSAITYMRRYALAAAVGIYAEDDDGNAASQPAPKQASKPAPPPAPKHTPPPAEPVAPMSQQAPAAVVESEEKMVTISSFISALVDRGLCLPSDKGLEMLNALPVVQKKGEMFTLGRTIPASSADKLEAILAKQTINIDMLVGEYCDNFGGDAENALNTINAFYGKHSLSTIKAGQGVHERVYSWLADGIRPDGVV